MQLNEAKMSQFITDVILPGISAHASEIKNLARIYEKMSPKDLRKEFLKVASKYNVSERSLEQQEFARDMAEGAMSDFLGGVWEWTKSKITSLYSWATSGFTPYVLFAALVYLTGGGYILLSTWGVAGKTLLGFLWTLFNVRIWDRIDTARDSEKMRRDDDIERERKRLGLSNSALDDLDSKEEWAEEA